ncbi:MAG: (2Fe-2S)-binding protein [Candidatus Dormibacteria bacterium]
MTPVTVEAVVNGQRVTRSLAPNLLLIDFLRDELGLTGVKQSCEVEVCGACTVLVDDLPVSACCFLAADIDQRRVQTVEGLVGTPFHQRLSDAFVRHAAVQCGFCIPGLILTAKALADRKVPATAADLREALSGNLCRCTGYHSILEALAEALGPEEPG